MSEFLLIIPNGWTQLDWVVCQQHQDLSQTSVLNWINANTLNYIEASLKELQLIPAESTVVDAKLLDDSYFMVKLG